MDVQIIQDKIYEIRGQRVMLDFDLAAMYQVPTKALKQAMKRNAERFPSDFMFQLTDTEWQELVTNCDRLPKTLKGVESLLILIIILIFVIKTLLEWCKWLL